MARSPAATELLEREQERARLADAWTQARAGHGSLWLLVAEPGGGKTRLAREVAALGRTFWGAAEPVSPPDPFAAVIAALPGFVPADTRAESVNRAIAALEEQSGGRPAILVLDDLHFADEGTVAVLVRLATACAMRPWLVIAALRPAEGLPALATAVTELVAQGRAQRLDVPPLSRQAVAVMVRGVRGATTGEEEIEAIYTGGGGNPWFTETLARSGADGVPALAWDRFSLRLDRLEAATPGAVALLEALAPAARPLPYAVVSALHGEESRTLRRRLTAVRDAGLLIEEAGTWRFRHELLRQALLGAMLDVERREAHGALAEALLAEGHAAELAMHFAEAGDPRAAEWALQAGLAARGVESHGEARAQFERALAFERDPEARRRLLELLSATAYSLGRIAESRQYAEDALAIEGGRPEDLAGLHWYAQRAAATLYDHIAAEEHLAAAEALLAERPVTFQSVQIAQARVSRALAGALPGRVEAAAAQALVLTEQLEDRHDAARVEFEVRRALITSRLTRADPAVFADLEDLLAFGRAHDLHPGHSLAALTAMHSGAPVAFFHREADALYARALETMQRLRFAWEGFLAPYRALALAQRGRYAEARSLMASQPQSLDTGTEMVLLLTAVLREARAGSPERARALIEGAPPLNVFRETALLDLARLELALLEEDAGLGDVAWWLYQIGDARQYARLAAVAAVALAQAGWEAPPPPEWLADEAPVRVFWVWAAALEARDEAALRAVAERLRALECPYEAALALRAAGDLAEAYRLLRDLDATTMRERLADELRQSGRPVPRRTRAAVADDGLTETERAVCRLIAAGARNQEAADSLGVSVHTVETHLSHIYQKTGVRGRVALAAWWKEREDG